MRHTNRPEITHMVRADASIGCFVAHQSNWAQLRPASVREVSDRQLYGRGEAASLLISGRQSNLRPGVLPGKLRLRISYVRRTPSDR